MITHTPHVNPADTSESAQIILPQNQVGRKHDIYISAISFEHCVAPRGIYIAIVSTTVETDDPVRELVPGLRLLGPIIERFDSVSDTFEPVEDGTMDRCFISKARIIIIL